MTAVVEIPDEVASEAQRHADRDGRELPEQFLKLIQLGLLAADIPAAVLERVRSAQNSYGLKESPVATPFSFSVDPSTGLPLIQSPPDAPIFSMTAEQALDLERQADLENDLEQAGIPVRH